MNNILHEARELLKGISKWPWRREEFGKCGVAFSALGGWKGMKRYCNKCMKNTDTDAGGCMECGLSKPMTQRENVVLDEAKRLASVLLKSRSEKRSLKFDLITCYLKGHDAGGDKILAEAKKLAEGLENVLMEDKIADAYYVVNEALKQWREYLDGEK